MKNRENPLIVLRSIYPSLFEVERKIADFILKQPEVLVNMTVAQISKKIAVADSSIIRFCQKLGFNGFTQLKINIAKNLKKPEELIFEDIDCSDNTETIITKVFASSIKALEDTVKMLDKNELGKAVDTLLNSEKIEIYGIGTSATIAMDIYYRLMRIGIPAYTATDPHIMRVSASKLDSNCTVIGISHTGRTKDTIEALRIAKEKGANVISITSFMNSPITDVSDINLITSTAETKIIKEAVSSRIAQIALLDSIYTCIALKKYDTTLENLENITEILNETRF